MSKNSATASLAHVFMAAFFGFLFISFIVAANLLRLEVIITHGIDQYVINVLTADLKPGSYGDLRTSFDLYRTRSLKQEPILHLPSGATIQYFGLQKEDTVPWIAVSVFDGTQRHDGFIPIRKNIEVPLFRGLGQSQEAISNFVSIWPGEREDRVKAAMKGVLYQKVENETEIRSTTNNIRMAEIKNSKDWYVLDEFSNDAKITYTQKKFKERYNQLHSLYIGSNFPAQVAQLKKTYVAAKEGPAVQSASYSLFSSWVFKLLFSVALISYFFYLISRPPKCESCGSKKTAVKSRTRTIIGYEYEKKDGSPDKRYKSNKAKIRQITTYACKECKEEFKRQKIYLQNQ